MEVLLKSKLIIDLERRVAETRALNQSLCGRYRPSTTVIIVTEVSDYCGLIGTVAEVTRFRDSGIITFTEEELQLARAPERVLKAGHRVHFYWRELKEIIYA